MYASTRACWRLFFSEVVQDLGHHLIPGKAFTDHLWRVLREAAPRAWIAEESRNFLSPGSGISWC